MCGGVVAESLQPTDDEAVLGNQLQAEIHGKPCLFMPLLQDCIIHRTIIPSICRREFEKIQARLVQE